MTKAKGRNDTHNRESFLLYIFGRWYTFQRHGHVNGCDSMFSMRENMNAIMALNVTHSQFVPAKHRINKTRTSSFNISGTACAFQINSNSLAIAFYGTFLSALLLRKPNTTEEVREKDRGEERGVGGARFRELA